MSETVAFAALGAAIFALGFLFGRRMPRKSKPLLVVPPPPLRIVAPLPGSRRWEVQR
jgi:hypothetical protein